jgi:hypothetical protein
MDGLHAFRPDKDVLLVGISHSPLASPSLTPYQWPGPPVEGKEEEGKAGTGAGAG